MCNPWSGNGDTIEKNLKKWIALFFPFEFVDLTEFMQALLGRCSRKMVTPTFVRYYT